MSDKKEKKGTEEDSRITIPWIEFKGLLKVDKDEIILTFEEFNTLMQQTDPQFTPQYDLIKGNVILSHKEFQDLINHFKSHPLAKTAPVRDYLFTKAVYSGTMNKEDFTFTADFSFIVLKDHAYIKIPILSASLALKSMTINNQPAIVINEGGYHCALIDHEGEYNLKAVFSIKSSLDQGPHHIGFPIQKIPITLAHIEIPSLDLEVDLPYASYLETRGEKNTTLIKAVLAACEFFDLSWKKKIDLEEKIPSMIYAESYQLISVEDDALKINQDIYYNILQSGVNSLQLGISEGISILSVSGSSIGDWQEIKDGEKRVLFIPFDYEQKGTFTLCIHAEKSFAEGATMIEFSGLEVLDTVNGFGEKGYIGVELKTSAELVLVDSSGLEKLMVKKLSKKLINKSSNPLLLGFRYLRHPYTLTLDVKKHEKVALPQATIDSASAVSFFTEDGLIINKVEYAVKNKLKQSLLLQLPQGALIWSAVVGQESVEVMRDGDIIYIPLISSREHDKKLESFKVELIYYTESEKFTLRGQKTVRLPQPDLTVSQLLWSIYIPEKFVYYRFITNLEKEELARGLTPILNREQIKVTIPSQLPYSGEKMIENYAGRRRATSFKNIDINGSFMSQQALNEFHFDNRLQQLEDKMIQGESQVYTGGVLPMNIQIPTSGQLFRFAKNIVRDEPLSITVYYFKDTIFTLLFWVGVGILIFIIILIRGSIKKFFIFIFNNMKKLMKIKKFFLSPLSLPIVGILFILSLSIGGTFAVICFLVMWITAMVHLDKKIKKSKLLIVPLFLLLSFLLYKNAPSVYGQSNQQETCSHVSIGWEEFKTTIGLEQDNVMLSWHEFQKILNQTSKESTPIYTIQDGKVRLGRDEFDKLLGEMRVPEPAFPAPLDHRLTKAVYKGKITPYGTVITADFTLQVLQQGDYKLIPILPSQLALEELRINNKPALMLTTSGHHHILVKESGNYSIRALFHIKSPLHEAHYQLSIPVVETSITLLEMEIPLNDIKVQIPQAQQVTISSQNNSMLINAIFPPVTNLSLQWYEKKPVAPVQEIPAKIYATSYSLVSIDDDALKVAMDIEYNILHAGIDELELSIPSGLNILSVKGSGVREWRERRQGKERILYISLDYRKKGIFWLTIEYEKTLLEAASTFSFSTLKTNNAVKDMGYVGFELKSSAEVKVIHTEGLEKVAVQKLPQRLFTKSLKPLIFGYKYLKHPYILQLDIQRHTKVSVTMAVIDSSNAVSFFTEDGKIVHRIVYELRNQLKQFLKIKLPENAELWSVFVGDKPAEPARENDLLYIPLIRSQEKDRKLIPFNVEIVFYQKDDPFSSYGDKAVSLPDVTEIIVSRILWSLYLPKDYNFLYFKGNVEKERMVSGIRPIMSCGRLTRPHQIQKSSQLDYMQPSQTDKIMKEAEDEKAEFQKFKARTKDMLTQRVMEKGIPQAPQAQISQKPGDIVSGYETAVLSIPISIPLSGQLYRFAQNMVRHEPLKITMVYTRGWIKDCIAVLIFIMIVAVLFIMRHKLNALKIYFQKMIEYMDSSSIQCKTFMSTLYNASVMPLIIIGFFLASLFTSHFVLALIFFIAGMCLFIHQWSYWCARKIRRRKDDYDKPATLKKSKIKLFLIASLGIIIFMLSIGLSLIGRRYPNYRIIVFGALCGLLYYIVLLILWIIKKITRNSPD